MMGLHLLPPWAQVTCPSDLQSSVASSGEAPVPCLLSATVMVDTHIEREPVSARDPTPLLIDGALQASGKNGHLKCEPLRSGRCPLPQHHPPVLAGTGILCITSVASARCAGIGTGKPVGVSGKSPELIGKQGRSSGNGEDSIDI